MSYEELNSDSNIQVLEDDEMFSERLLGLIEMVPESFQAPLETFGKCIWSGYQTLCDASWVFITTAAILFGPAMFEAERQNQDSHNKSDKNQHTVEALMKKLPAETQ